MKKRSIAFILITLALFSGCSKYKTINLKCPEWRPLRPDSKKHEINGALYYAGTPPNRTNMQRKGIHVISNDLTLQEEKDIFSGRSLLKRGFRGIHLYIRNNTDYSFTLNPAEITLPLEGCGGLIRAMKRAVGFKTLKYSILLGIPFGMVECFSSVRANHAIKKDLKDKILNPEVVYNIKPWGILNKILLLSDIDYNFYSLLLRRHECRGHEYHGHKCHKHKSLRFTF